MAIASNLGFPRIGVHRELKKALEEYWSGQSKEEDLLATGQALRREHWLLQKQLGLQHIPSNDFSFYDHVLDTACMVGAVPARYGTADESVTLPMYFAMARGSRGPSFRGTNQEEASGLPAMEMTKWFDTNYHYLVPEFTTGQRFRVASRKPVDEFLEAKALGIQSRPVLLGPLSFLLLGKSKSPSLQVLSLLGSLVPVYGEMIQMLADAGADWIQFDEPVLALDINHEIHSGLLSAYERLRLASPRLRLLVATYFGGLRENLDWALQLPVSAIHLDLVRDPQQLEEALSRLPKGMMLSLGVIDGRNVWRTDLNRALALIERAAQTLGNDRIFIAPSCSLLHSPVDLNLELRMDHELRDWLAFARQKLEEVVILTRAINEGRSAVQEYLNANQDAIERRRRSARILNLNVKESTEQVSREMLRRKSPYQARQELQRKALKLPLLPTTTIGSFPQTAEIRAVRAGLKAGKRTPTEYKWCVRTEIEKTIRFQEEIGLDVLVHGEFERNDMIEFFAEKLTGFSATENGWVQSYGSRCVKPPIIYGDVARPESLTGEWIRFAQSLTPKPVKGMLTGPVTILEWSFARDDQSRADTCRQIALAIRAEACDLEASGIRVIQIDEPGFREGLPLRRSERNAYLKWAVEAFRLASSGVRNDTQIHTHMCYAEFGDVIDAIAEMDADVISMESSRSGMELFEAFTRSCYPKGIGPGVYDVHSSRVPTKKEIEDLLEKALQVFSPSQLWVNPDCGLKTRRWEEVRPALTAMVEAARNVRKAYDESVENSTRCTMTPE